MTQFFKILGKQQLASASDESLVVGSVTYPNPSLTLLHKLGYWPMDPELPEVPEEEDGYKIFDDGYFYRDDGAGGRFVTRRYRKLKIVDSGLPVIHEGQVLIEDRWEERETEYVHVVTVYDVVDTAPEIDETTHHLKEKRWILDAENKKKVAEYVIVRRVDETPACQDGEEIVEDRWLYVTLDSGEEVYKRYARIMTVLRNPPERAEDEEIVDTWFEDDEETNTRTYFYKVLRIIDTPPELAEGEEIVDRWFVDDETERTRTWHYAVRTVVDEPPQLDPTDSIESEWWDDDGVTRTHRYEVHRRIDVPPVLSEGQDIISSSWTTEQVGPYLVVHTRRYEVRTLVDPGVPALDSDHFVYADFWHDDGVTYTHVYDVWELKDEPRPELDETLNRISSLGTVDDPVAKTRGVKWIVKPIIRNKPEDDPDGNFTWVEDGERESGEQIEILYKKVLKVWRRISKLSLEAAVFQLGLLDRYDAYIDGIEIENAHGQKVSARRFYDQANELLESHPLFKPYYRQGLSALGLTEEQGDALLEQCTVV